jgi:hypothetical protein
MREHTWLLMPPEDGALPLGLGHSWVKNQSPRAAHTYERTFSGCVSSASVQQKFPNGVFPATVNFSPYLTVSIDAGSEMGLGGVPTKQR